MTSQQPGGARRVIIMGAAGRDFHDFNVAFRDDPLIQVVAFTATQIPFIADRKYPRELAGEKYPDGIPIVDESKLTELIHDHQVDEVVFSYSDVDHSHVMHLASKALSAGADFRLLAARSTMLKASVPVVAVCATRTGSGKSQTTRRVAQILEEAGIDVTVIRHPMPYGDLTKQAVQRFETYDDLDAADCTIEEREEYEPHLRQHRVVFAGIDYVRIIAEAEKEAKVIVWDGGNNDLPFLQPDVHIVVTDPLRPDHAVRYHPGETNLLMADAVVVNKVDSATPEQVETVTKLVEANNPRAQLVLAESVVSVEDAAKVKGARVLAIEDGPTLTHGEMKFGAGVVGAERNGALEVVDPRQWAVGSLKQVYETYDVGPVLPAMGYSDGQIADLEATINAVDCDIVLVATPIDLRKLVDIQKPALRVTYELKEVGSPNLKDVLRSVILEVNA